MAVLRSIVVVAEHVLSLQVSRSVRNLFVAAASQTHVFERLLVNREEANSGTHFRRHVGDGGTIGNRQLSNTRAVEFDELVDDPVKINLVTEKFSLGRICLDQDLLLFSQVLGDNEYQVGRSGLRVQRASQFVTNNFGQNHGDLPKDALEREKDRHNIVIIYTEYVTYRLVQHDSFGFNTTDTPSNAENESR